MDADENAVQAVLSGLEDSRYSWRTLGGLVADTGLSDAEVLKALKALEPEVVTTLRDNTKLFSTRRHYALTEGLLNKSLSALSGRIR